MLFESSCGYVLFEARDVYKVERHYFATEAYIKSFDKNFKFVACHTFESSDEALMYLIDDENGMFLVVIIKMLGSSHQAYLFMFLNVIIKNVSSHI